MAKRKASPRIAAKSAPAKTAKASSPKSAPKGKGKKKSVTLDITTHFPAGSWAHVMFNSVDGVLPLTFPQMKAAYVLCMARPWFSAAPFVNDDQLPRGLEMASEHFVTLCDKATAHLSLSVPADIGTIIGADFTAAQADEAACKIFDIYMDRHVLGAPRRANADWEPPLANKLKQWITADNPGLPTGYNLWKKLTNFLPACMQHGLVGTTASSEAGRCGPRRSTTCSIGLGSSRRTVCTYTLLN